MKSLPARFERSVLRVYQAWSATRLPRCRYLPTCSHYAVEALHGHGFWRGNRLIVSRLLRCHPWGGWGVDPVPSADSRVPAHHFRVEIRAHS